ncbi:hypothetical protein [Pseudorhodobacter sp.]|uniref:hypothetical protein n=1 Tax=Pseudorhodobacter sp. TaxID=1934400 RepID=UPI002AFE2583|nr:hypothetical protein [Pseudorhodobacter sp.]
MSTWISKTVLLLPLLVSGCVMPDATAGGGQGAVRQSLSLGGLELVGPSGFCPVSTTQQRLAGADFVAFAPCSGEKGPILAATIGGEGSAAGITLKRDLMAPYFETSEGQAALRGAGNTDAISVHEVADYKGAVVLRLTRQSKGKSNDSWRALMQSSGRLVTLSVRPRSGTEIPQTDGRRLVTRFVDAMRRANGS